MGEHGRLSAVMGVMGNHVGEHGNARRPWPGPAIAQKTLPAAPGSSQSFREHLGAAFATFGQRISCLFLGAAAALKRRWELEVWSGEPEPLAANVVDVREDGGDGATFVARPLRLPRARVELLQKKLVHSIVQSISLQYFLR